VANYVGLVSTYFADCRRPSDLWTFKAANLHTDYSSFGKRLRQFWFFYVFLVYELKARMHAMRITEIAGRQTDERTSNICSAAYHNGHTVIKEKQQIQRVRFN